MAHGSLDCVQAIVLHAGFLDRLNDGQVSLAATLRAAKSLAPIVHFLKATNAQRGIAPTDISAHPHGTECLAKRAEGVGQASVTADDNAAACHASYVSNDNTLRHAGAQQC